MKPLSELDYKAIKPVKLIIFDVDGVLVPRGTVIKQDGNKTYFETKEVSNENTELIKELVTKYGFKVNISSGRSIHMLKDMFREVLPYVSITYENGSASLVDGWVTQYINTEAKLYQLSKVLRTVKNKNIKGFEQKEFIITIHCENPVIKIENIVKKCPCCYCIWNGEAYDIGITKQTKGLGVKRLAVQLGIKKKEVLAIGDNLNDAQLIEQAGLKITADKSRLAGDYHIPLNGKELPATILMKKLISVLGKAGKRS
jgi:HAD superfamily hydrolase (TIGR01484 family)